VVVDLAKIGWTPPTSESNRTFFKDFTLSKLFAIDQDTRVVFLDEDVIVVYHTKQDGKDWRTAPRIMEAFFIRVRDGTLLSRQRWPTGLRKSMDDLFDSEARLIPLHNSRFLVFANGVITEYGPNLELLKQKKLEPSASTDLWSAQSVSGGKAIVLRHESTSGQVTYSWLMSDSLEEKFAIRVYQGRDFSAGQGVYADENSVYTRSRTGIRMIDRDQSVRTICDDPLCREDGRLRVLSSHHVGWSGRSGIGIVDTERGGLAWSKTAQPQYPRNKFQFGEMRSAMSGTKFAAWVAATGKKAFFDGVEIGSTPTILVYDFARSKDDPVVIRMNPVEGLWDSALSPNGTKLALFDGSSLQIFSL
jgi:hypothetical protein